MCVYACACVCTCAFIFVLFIPFDFWQIYWKHSRNQFLIQQLIINFILTFSAPFHRVRTRPTTPLIFGRAADLWLFPRNIPLTHRLIECAQEEEEKGKKRFLREPSFFDYLSTRLSGERSSPHSEWGFLIKMWIPFSTPLSSFGWSRAEDDFWAVVLAAASLPSVWEFPGCKSKPNLEAHLWWVGPE